MLCHSDSGSPPTRSAQTRAWLLVATRTQQPVPLFASVPHCIGAEGVGHLKKSLEPCLGLTEHSGCELAGDVNLLLPGAW